MSESNVVPSSSPPAAKDAERDLRTNFATNERFDLTCRALGGVLYDWDAQRGTVVRSEGLYPIVGFHPHEVPHQVSWWESRIHPDDVERVRHSFNNSQTHFEAEYRVQHRDGHYIHVWDQSLIIRDESGAIRRVVGCNLDISKQKRVEKVLDAAYQAEHDARRAAEDVAYQLARLQSVTNALSRSLTPQDVAKTIVHDLVSHLSPQRILVYAVTGDGLSFSLLGQHGYEAGELAPLTVLPVTSDLVLSEAFRAQNIVVLAAPRTVVAVPFMLGENATGALQIEFRTRRPIAPDVQQYLGIVAEQCAQALERARLYEAERLARERAEAANRAKDEFFATVSHELRSPLQSILGWIRLARTSKLDPASSARALEVMERNTRAQVQLVSDMLEASRIITGKISLAFEPLTLSSILESAYDSLNPTAMHKGISLSLEIPSSLPMVWADPNRVQQIFWNLLSNAIKFTPQGGKVSVRAAVRDAAVVVEVADSGEGIAPDFLPQLFTRFSQADESSTRIHGGLGLGLAIVRHLVELHGGTVEAQSEGLGKGAIFKVSFPVRELHMLESKIPHAAAASEPFHRVLPARGASGSIGGVRVLLVEDTTDTRDFLVAVLQGAGAIVAAVTSAEQARQVMDEFKPQILLSDIGLPEEDGYSLIKDLRLKLSAAELPAAALTAYARDVDRTRAVEAGFQCHITKPVDPDDLIEAVRRLLPESPTALAAST